MPIVVQPLTPADAEWYYADQNDVLDLIDEETLQIISQLDSSLETIDSARITTGGEWSDAYIDQKIENLYTVPLDNMSSPTTLLMADISARLTAWWLYNSRGSREAQNGQSQAALDVLFKNHKQIADSALDRIKSNIDKLTADRPTGLPSSGIAVADVDGAKLT